MSPAARCARCDRLLRGDRAWDARLEAYVCPPELERDCRRRVEARKRQNAQVKLFERPG